jgi:hypothetical protein
MTIFCGCLLCQGGGALDQSGSFSATGGGDGKPSFGWDAAANQLTRNASNIYLPSFPSPLTLTYAYRETATAPAVPPGASSWIGGLNSDMGGFVQFNSTQIQIMEMVVALVEDVANVNFVRVGTGTTGPGAYTDNAELLIGNYSSGAATSYGGWGQYNFYKTGSIYARAGKVWLDATESYIFEPTALNGAARLYIHELMHTIGVSHPGNYNVTSPGYSYAASAVYSEDSGQYTVMSYFDESETGADWGSTRGMTPLLHDIAALQDLYGPNVNTRTGNTIYGFNSNTGYEAFTFNTNTSRRAFSIWDADGIDTLDLSGYLTSSIVNLMPESFSSAGTRGDGGPMLFNISIARGVTIENAIGGSGNDQFTGNGANNTLDGGLGADTALFAGLRAQYQITKTAGGYQVRDLTANRDGTDQLANMEIARFSDRSVDFTVAAAAAGVNAGQLKTLLELYVGFFNRIPEAAGVKYWIDQLKATNDLTGIANQFYAAGVQFSAQTGYSAAMTNAEFITKVYANVLGRSGATAPNAGEIAYWNDRLVSGADTKGSMVLTMISNVHQFFTNDPTWGFVASLLTNKSTVANTYAIQQGLSYNTPEENITQGMAMAAAVTPTSTAAAIALIGVSDVFV